MKEIDNVINNQRIICGDVIQKLRELPDESVDLIVTDPPYNLNKDYGKASDNLEFSEYLVFSKDWIGECYRVLKPNGTIYIFMGVRYISYIYEILEKDFGMYFNSWITWYYTQGIGKIKGFSPRHDDILMFTKSEKNYTFDLDAIRVPQKYYRSVNNMRGANPGNVWEFSHIHYCNGNRQNHPTQKPEGLYERMILASSQEGDVVLDPFGGSGTCVHVCQHTGRNGITIELNPDYCEMIIRRLQEPFHGFDSLDERITRCPNDLNDDAYRASYIRNHIEWFLKNHEDAVPIFLEEVKNKYLMKMRTAGQTEIFKQYGIKID